MDYIADMRGGKICTKTKEDMEKALAFLKEEDIFYNECIETKEDGTFEATVFGSTVDGYHEEGYQKLADLCTKGSCLQFLGEDSLVWTLYLDDGKIENRSGTIVFDMSDPEELVHILTQAGYTVRKSWAVTDPGTTLSEYIRTNYPEHLTTRDRFPVTTTWDIGFINPEIVNYQGDGIANDETQFRAESVDELEELYEDFCKENNLPADTVTYAEIVHEYTPAI